MTITVAWAHVEGPVDLVSVGHFVRDDHRFLWLSGETADSETGPHSRCMNLTATDTSSHDRDGIIAWGEVDDWAAGADRTAAEFVGSLPESMPDSPRPPIVVGGFAFDPKRPTTERWARFGAGRLIVPATQVIRRNGQTLVQSFGRNQVEADARLANAQAMIDAGRGRGVIRFDDLDVTIKDRTADSYYAIVKQAVESIDSEHLDKVVLARAIDIVGDIPLGAWLAALRAKFSTCAVFARGEGPRTFFGASPEVLVKVEGHTVHTAAIAGTRPRGHDKTEDDRLGAELMSSAKERAEHRFVVDEIRARLTAAGIELNDSPPTGILKIPGIQHLHTPVTGRRDTTIAILDLVDTLHPTPAVGGNPNDVAVEWIRDHEELDRGWYSGPVGWTDTSGQGEFRVGLRSGLHHATGTRLFAGCGVVAASVPEDELEETRTKFAALLSCLGRS